MGWYQFFHIELDATVSGVCVCTHSESMPRRCVRVEVRGQLGGLHFHLPVRWVWASLVSADLHTQGWPVFQGNSLVSHSHLGVEVLRLKICSYIFFFLLNNDLDQAMSSFSKCFNPHFAILLPPWNDFKWCQIICNKQQEYNEIQASSQGFHLWVQSLKHPIDSFKRTSAICILPSKSCLFWREGSKFTITRPLPCRVKIRQETILTPRLKALEVSSNECASTIALISSTCPQCWHSHCPRQIHSKPAYAYREVGQDSSG